MTQIRRDAETMIIDDRVPRNLDQHVGRLRAMNESLQRALSTQPVARR